MKRLYTPEEAQRWRRRTRISLALSIALFMVILAVCIFLCTRVDTAGARRLLMTNIVLFTLAGWTVILILYCIHAPAKAQAVHMEGILHEQEEVHEGVFTLQPGAFRIPRSIAVRSASITSEEDSLPLHISAALARQLPPSGTRLRVWTVRKFIVAYEVIA